MKKNKLLKCMNMIEYINIGFMYNSFTKIQNKSKISHHRSKIYIFI